MGWVTAAEKLDMNPKLQISNKPGKFSKSHIESLALVTLSIGRSGPQCNTIAVLCCKYHIKNQLDLFSHLKTANITCRHTAHRRSQIISKVS